MNKLWKVQVYASAFPDLNSKLNKTINDFVMYQKDF